MVVVAAFGHARWPSRSAICQYSVKSHFASIDHLAGWTQRVELFNRRCSSATGSADDRTLNRSVSVLGTGFERGDFRQERVNRICRSDSEANPNRYAWPPSSPPSRVDCLCTKVSTRSHGSAVIPKGVVEVKRQLFVLAIVACLPLCTSANADEKETTTPPAWEKENPLKPLPKPPLGIDSTFESLP